MKPSRWPPSERPRERLLEAGPQALSDGELLAILFGTGTRGQSAAELARALLGEWGSLTALLGSAPAELGTREGLGPGAGRAARWPRSSSAAAISARRSSRAARSRHRADAARFLKARLLDLPHEVFCCLFLDTRHRLIRYEELFRGTIDGATVYPREVVKRALAAQRVGRHPGSQSSVGRLGAERGRSQHHVEACEGAGAWSRSGCSITSS